jgi:thiamine biosynthesis protein ThiS
MPVVDGKKLDLKAENVSQMVVELKIEEDFIAIVKNGKIVPRSKWDSEKISSDDSIEIFSPVSGG